MITNGFHNGIALWARGNVLLCLDLSEAIRMEDGREEAFLFACHCAQMDLRRISAEQWTDFASQILHLPKNLSATIFQAALMGAKCAEHSSVNSTQIVPVSLLSVALALLGRFMEQNVVDYIRENAALFCTICMLPQMQFSFAEHTDFHTFYAQFSITPIPWPALTSLDALFEGTLLGNENSEKPPFIYAKRLSALLGRNGVGAFNVEKFSLSTLSTVFERCLQADLFQLDQNSTTTAGSNQRKRSLTAATNARRRRLQIRDWERMEILTAPALRGGNLRLTQAQCGASPVFHPLALETAVMSNCESAGPIVLGPIRCFLLVQNVRNVAISTICPHIRLQNCQHVTVFCQHEQPILLLGICKGVRIAPYNVFYDSLAMELAYNGMKLQKQNELLGQNSNLAVQLNSSLGEQTETHTVVAAISPLPVEQFYMQPTPFPATFDGKFYKQFLNTIPQNYINSWQKVEQNARERAEELNGPQLSELCPLKRGDLNYLMRKVKH